MKIANNINVPDDCPEDCLYFMDTIPLCRNCPIPCCLDNIVRPENFRRDWAIEWKKFFETGEEPVLNFSEPIINF